MDYHQMSESPSGRFCSSCSKEVVDFTQKSNEEIIDFLQQANGERVCGRVRKEPSQRQKLQIKALRWMTVAAGMFLCFVNSKKAMAQEYFKLSEQDSTSISKLKKNITISGIVYDAHENETIPFANVIAMNGDTQIGIAQSDFDGKFSIKIDTSLYQNVDLSFYYPGYDHRIVKGIPIDSVSKKYEMTSGMMLGYIITITEGIIDISETSTGSHYNNGIMESGIK